MKHAVLPPRSPAVGAQVQARWPVVGLFATGTLATVVGGLTAYGVSRFMGAAIVACVFIAVLLVAPAVLRWATGTFDVFEPAMIISGVYVFYFVLGPLARIATGDFWFIDRNFEAVYLPALAAVALAVGAMWLGYALPIGPAAAPPGRSLPPRTAASVRFGRRLAGMLLVGAALGMVLWARLAGRSLLYFLLPGISRPVDNAEGGVDIPYFFFAVEWFIPAVTMLIALGGLRRRSTRYATIGLLSVVYISIGFRYRVAVLWFAVAIVTYLRAGRRPRLLFLIVPTTFAFLLGGWLAGARAFFRSGGMEGSLAFDLKGSILGGLSDTRIFETLGAVVTTVPRFLPHAGLLPFVYPIILVIPRRLWPGKPYPFWLQYNVQSIGTGLSGTSGAAIPQFRRVLRRLRVAGDRGRDVPLRPRHKVALALVPGRAHRPVAAGDLRPQLIAALSDDCSRVLGADRSGVVLRRPARHRAGRARPAARWPEHPECSGSARGGR